MIVSVPGRWTSFREARRVWRASLFVASIAPALSAQAPARLPLTAFDSAKAEALLRTRLPCLGCHVLGGQGGAVGPDLTHVAARRPAAYVAAIIENPQRVVPGTTMPRTPMPEAVRALITAYIAGGNVAAAAASPASPALSMAGTPVNAPALYARQCAACHGERGDGNGPNAKRLPVPPARHADAVAMSAMTDHRLFDAISVGGYPMGRSPMMPAFGQSLTRDEIQALVRHIRQLCRCSGPAWGRIADPPPGRGG